MPIAYHRMSQNGYTFATALVKPHGMMSLFPSFVPKSPTATLVPLWIKSKTDTHIVCVFGSEPPPDAQDLTVPRDFFVNLTTIPPIE